MVVTVAAELSPEAFAAVRAEVFALLEPVFPRGAQLRAEKLLEFPLPAVGAFQAAVAPDQVGACGKDHEDRKEDDQDVLPGEVAAPGIAQIHVAPFEHRGRSLQPGEHARVVVVRAEGRKHITLLDPPAKGVGKRPFESVARHEADFVTIPDQQHPESVVAFGTAHAPLAEQFDGEFEDVAPRDVAHGDDRHLGIAPRTQRPAQRVEPRDGLRGENAVGIRHVAPPVEALHVGDIVHTIGGGNPRKKGCGKQRRKQKQFFHLFKNQGQR